jgi:hypothetical protein
MKSVVFERNSSFADAKVLLVGFVSEKVKQVVKGILRSPASGSRLKAGFSNLQLQAFPFVCD